MAAPHSTRVAANPSRALQQAHRPDSPSSLSVFLTNLRLLDLDLLPDWPDISSLTFASSGAAVQGQKRRIQFVEWALFHLFSLWDPQEAANKLKPFFPPLDQMQSLNLRAALLRALDNAKKTGALGRDSVIRRTMLDECKGERLEEVLANFSTAVLKRALALDTHRVGRHPALAAKLVLEERGYRGNDAELIALVVAHRLSLRRFLERKDVARARYRDFALLLSAKERALARRDETLRRLEQHGDVVSVSENSRAEMRRTVRTNWSGNEGWMNALVGDSDDTSERSLLTEPFDRVWLRVQQGRLPELEESGGDLLDQLDSRVRIQKERLKKWDAFRIDALDKKSEQPLPGPAAPAARGLDLNFVHHQNLQVDSSTTRVSSLGREKQALGEFAGLVNELQDQLAQIRGRGQAPCSLPSRTQARSPDVSDGGAVSEMSDVEDAGNGSAVEPSECQASTELDVSRRMPSSQYDTRTASVEGPEVPQKDFSMAQLFDHDTHVLDPADRKNLWEASSLRSPSPRPSEVWQATLSESESPVHAPTPTQELADHILEMMDNATPSPNKRTKPRPTLSLTQRTCLSMARADSLFLEGDEPESPLGPVAVDEAAAAPGPAVADSMLVADQDGPDDLVSRTRRSMAGFEKAKHKAQVERRRSQTKSRAPPRKEGSQFPTVEEEREPEAEISVCEDMEAVFRSRPRIKASPIPSPTRDSSQD